MQNQTEIKRINKFLYFVAPIITAQVKTLLHLASLKVKQESHGLDLVFSISSGKKEVQFHLQNLLLEIATIDRDDEPLRFDENLRDFDYFVTKTVRVTQSKLNVLFHFLGEEDVDAAIENITKDAKQFERVRIWRFDQKPT